MSTEGIKVSVVVTTYNQEDTIGRTLDSILMQQCGFPYEICLTDDCSTDSTPDICRAYADKYPGIIRFRRNDVNRGCRDNYFDTLLRCQGEYIADCAGDDYWTDPLKLQKQVDILDSDPGITLVHTGWEYTDSVTGAIATSDPRQKRRPYLKPVSMPGELFIPVLQHKAHSIIHLCSSMYRRDIFTREYETDTNLFRCRDFPCEDFQLMVIYAKAGKIAYLPDITMRYSVGHKSVSSRESDCKTFDFYLGSLKLTIYLAEKFKVPPLILASTYRNFTSFLFAMAYFARDSRRIQTLTGLIEEKNLPFHWKSRWLLPTTGNRWVWNSVAALKAATSRIRQAIRK